MHSADFTIDFAEEGNSRPYMKSGWSTPEKTGSWTCDFHAELQFDNLDIDTSYECTVILRPYLAKELIESQELNISCRGVRLFSRSITRGEVISFNIPNAAVTEKPLIISFAIPDAAIPRILGLSNDSRRLGVSVAKLSMRRLHAEATDHDHKAVVIESRARVSPGKSPIAAVTMVYNEREYLPIWLSHYSRQVGLENCYVADHGSNDGSLDQVEGCNVIRVPRVSYDPIVQSEFTSKFCSSLLSWYRYVIFTDVDEIVVADPATAATLTEFVDRPLPEITNMIGLNVVHRPSVEPNLT